MNTKNNKRRRESVNKIEKAFIELLQNKELNEIKVSDICKICSFLVLFKPLWGYINRFCISNY